MSKSQEAPATSHADDVSAPQTSPKPERLNSARYLIFFVLEVAFTALAWYCYFHPLVLKWFDLSAVENKTVRSGLTALFTLWHTAAIEGVLYLYKALPSRTRAARDESEPEELATKIFWFASLNTVGKFALLAYPVMQLFRIVGISAITASDGVGSEQPLPIGLISTFSLDPYSTDVTSRAFVERTIQANMIVRLEQVYKQAWGYISQPNLLIPLPTDDLNSTLKVLYESDVVTFHHNCQWKAPDNYSGNNITIGKNTWTAGVSSNATAVSGSHVSEYGPSIIFLLPVDHNVNLTGVSAYLFLGWNATILPVVNSTSVNSSIDLSDLPTIYNPEYFIGRFTSARSLRAPLATVLVCTPSFEFLSRRVKLEPTADRTDPDVTLLNHFLVHSPKNIQQQAARNLFSVILNTTVMSHDPTGSVTDRGSVNYNIVSSTMLLNGTVDEGSGSFSPLDLNTINQNVDAYTLSAFKAFISGYQGRVPKLRSQTNIFALSVGGEFSSSKLALSTSHAFLVLYTALFGVLCMIIGVLWYSERVSRPS